jgi:prolyl oligopeptidase
VPVNVNIPHRTPQLAVHLAHPRNPGRATTHGHPYYYFENTEGGHGSGVTSEQRAKMFALTWTYLWERLARTPAL